MKLTKGLAGHPNGVEREKIIETLKEVMDPETLVDVISMGLIKNLVVTESGEVSLEIHPSSPVYPLALPLVLDIQTALRTLKEISNLDVKLANHKMAEEVNNILGESYYE